MRKQIVYSLFEEFHKNELGKATVMKFMFNFQNVEVSVYFDGYDEKMPMFILILKCKLKVSFLSLNLYDFSDESMERADICAEIREKILVDNSYEQFISRVFQELQNKEYVFRNYKADLPFKQLEKSQYNQFGLHPFFGGFERGRMEPEYLELIYQKFTVSREVLEMLQEKGFTIRTVGKCKERKKIEKELAKLNS